MATTATTAKALKSRHALDRQAILRRLETIEKSLDFLITQDMVRRRNMDVDLREALHTVQHVIDNFPTLNGWENR